MSPSNQQKHVTSFFGIPKRKLNQSNSRFEMCPICWNSFPRHTIQNHVEECLLHKSNQNTTTTTTTKKEEKDPPTYLLATAAMNKTPTVLKHSPTSNKVSVKKWNDSSSSHFYSLNEKKNTTTTFYSKKNSNNNNDESSHGKSHSKSNLESCRKQWNDLFSSPTKRVKRDNNDNETAKHVVDTTNLLTPSLEEPIPGLFLYENFITNDEEKLIISALDTEKDNPWRNNRFNGIHLGKRWGVHCNLRDRRVDMPQIPLPSFIRDLLIPKLNKVLKPSIMKGCIPNEANAIDYRKNSGHYLKHHVDDRFLSKEPIANLSLSGSCYMTFIHEKKKHDNNNNNHNNNALSSIPTQKKVLLRPKTLLILTGKSRYDYSHGIYHEDLLSTRRISITMRESPLSIRNNTTITKCFNHH